MSEVLRVEAGGYRFLRGVFQYSAGVAAEPGFEIRRARFVRPVPLTLGFARISAYLWDLGRPLTAFCACELRSPAPFTDAGFETFNRSYIGPLEAWGLYRDGVNPIARSNVCPEIDKPAEPGFHAFSYTVPTRAGTLPTFVIAGSGESPEGHKSYEDGAVRLGDRSDAGMLDKARFVLAEMERRMAALGFSWTDATATQLYTVYNVHPILSSEIVERGAMRAGLTWHYCRPPVEMLDYEMDVRGVRTEIVLD